MGIVIPYVAWASVQELDIATFFDILLFLWYTYYLETVYVLPIKDSCISDKLMNAIDIHHVSKIYRKGFRAIKVPAAVDLTFSVKKNRVTGFVGPNGAGKTTTIKMIMGLVYPTSGFIKLNGLQSRFPAARRGVAYLSEQPYFYGHLTVYEALKFAANLLYIPSSSIGTQIERVLSVVELSEKVKVKVKELSKGMQQRLNMAQALLGDPHLLILDEPMSGMDPPGRRLFRNLFRDLAKEGKTIFFSSHVLDDIEAVCDEVVVLSKGKLTYAGAISELLDRGFSGTDITVRGLAVEIISQLESCGCDVSGKDNDVYQVFVPREGNIGLIQNSLFSGKVEIQSIVKRSMPLEDLLYNKK